MVGKGDEVRKEKTHLWSHKIGDHSCDVSGRVMAEGILTVTPGRGQSGGVSHMEGWGWAIWVRYTAPLVTYFGKHLEQVIISS